MSFVIDPLHDFVIIRCELESLAYGYEGHSREATTLRLELLSSIHSRGDERALKGELNLHRSESTSELMPGSWAFYESHRFSADVTVHEAFLMRIWTCFMSKPDWMFLNINEAPEASELNRNYEGAFRLNVRGGSTRPAPTG